MVLIGPVIKILPGSPFWDFGRDVAAAAVRVFVYTCKYMYAYTLYVCMCVYKLYARVLYKYNTAEPPWE